MTLEKKQIEWIRGNKFQIAQILEKLIEDRKEQLVDEEDEEKREKLRMWVKELRIGLSILRGADVEKTKEGFTGI